MKKKHRRIKDARGRAVTPLDPVAMHLLRRHDVIGADVLRAIANEQSVRITRSERTSLIVGIVLLFTVAGAFVHSLFKGDFGGGPLARTSSLAWFSLLPWVMWIGIRRARFGNVSTTMLKYRRCPHCGYDLRLLPTDPEDGATVCPECGCAWRLNGFRATGTPSTTYPTRPGRGMTGTTREMAHKETSRPQQAQRAKGTRGKPAALHAVKYPFRQAWRAFQTVDGAYLRGHPELELFPTVKHRRLAVRRVVSKFVWRRTFWSAVAQTGAFAVLLGLLAFALLIALRTWYPMPIRTVLPWAVVPAALVIAVAALFANRWMRRSVPELLRHELLDCGVPVCVACGYPLFGLSGPNCPECGSPFDAKVRQILDRDADPSVAE